jgi:hypothetical protein
LYKSEINSRMCPLEAIDLLFPLAQIEVGAITRDSTPRTCLRTGNCLGRYRVRPIQRDMQRQSNLLPVLNSRDIV